MDRKQRKTVTPSAGPLMSTREAAHALGISISSLYRLMSSGQLPWTKIGGQRKIPRADLESFARSQLTGESSLLEFSASDGRDRANVQRIDSKDSSNPGTLTEQTRRDLSAGLQRVQQDGDLQLALAYLRVLVDLEAQATRGG